MIVARKMQAARERLERRFHGGLFPGKQCVAILDLLRFVATTNPIPALRGLPDFHLTGTTWIRPRDANDNRGYGRAHWFRRFKSEMKLAVESEPRERWLAPFAVTLFADDRTGLLPDEVFGILEVLLAARLTLVELAFDFSFASGVTREYVLQHGVFGKSHRDLTGNNPSVDWWGARNGAKRVKSYFKGDIAAHRVEFRLRTRFLRDQDIGDVFDFWKFEQLLPRHHFLFARLDEEKIAAQLRRTRNAAGTRSVLREIGELDGDLTAQMKVLRDAGLKNTRRLLIPLKRNRLVREAVREWGNQWPKTPAHLGSKR
jgi:hypothetical protein